MSSRCMRERGLLLFVFNKKQPAAAGFARPGAEAAPPLEALERSAGFGAPSKVSATSDPCHSEEVARRPTKNLLLTVRRTEEADSSVGSE
jgi:hypothetical protein